VADSTVRESKTTLSNPTKIACSNPPSPHSLALPRSTQVTQRCTSPTCRAPVLITAHTAHGARIRKLSFLSALHRASVRRSTPDWRGTTGRGRQWREGSSPIIHCIYTRAIECLLVWLLHGYRHGHGPKSMVQRSLVCFLPSHVDSSLDRVKAL